MPAKLCISCNKPGTPERRVGSSGYHIDCKPAEPAPAEPAGDEKELQVGRDVVRRVRKLLPLIEDGTITPVQFATLIADMPGCREAFGPPAADK